MFLELLPFRSVSLVIVLKVMGISNYIFTLYVEIDSASVADGSGIKYNTSL